MFTNEAQRFWTRWQAAVDSDATDVQLGLFSFARTKLYGLQYPDASLSPERNSTKSNGQLAALGIRLMLEFEPLRESADKEAKLVEGHMRVTYSVPTHRQYLRSGAPSEPVLAEAAARVMSEIHGGPLGAVTGYLRNGLISKGVRGELVARLLLTLAHNKCVRFDSAKVHEAQYSKAVPLSDFLEALVGHGHMQKILKSRPDNVPGGATFKEAFKHAKVNFTHFVKGGDESVITDEAAFSLHGISVHERSVDDRPLYTDSSLGREARPLRRFWHFNPDQRSVEEAACED